MNRFLGKPGPWPVPAQDRPGLCPPADSPDPSLVRLLQHIHPSLPTPLLLDHRRPFYRHPGDFMTRFLIATRRRYPIQRAMPTKCWTSCHQEAELSERNSWMVCNPGTEQIPSTSSNQRSSPARNACEPGAKETTLSALKGMKKGMVEKELPGQMTNSTLTLPARNDQDQGAKNTALKEIKKRTLEEEDQRVGDNQESKRKCHESSGRGPSTTEPLEVHGSLDSLVPKGSLTFQTPENHFKRPEHTCSRCSLSNKLTCGIPVHKRNAITSSYSSTGGISQLWKRRRVLPHRVGPYQRGDSRS